MVSLKSLLENNRSFFGLTILFVLISRLGTFFYPFGSDHWIFYYIGREINQGKNLYTEIWDHKGPLIFYFNSFLDLLFGDNLILHRIFLTILVAVDIYLFYILAKLFLSRLDNFKLEEKLIYSRLAVLVYAFFRNLSQFASSGNNTEALALPFLLASYILFLKFIDHRKLYLLLFSGLCFSFVVSLKLNLIIFFLPIFIELIDLDKKNYFKGICLNILFSVPILIHQIFWLVWFYFQGSFTDYIQAAFLFNSRYWQNAGVGGMGNNSVFIFITLFLFVPLFIFMFTAAKSINIKNLNFRFVYYYGCFSTLFILISGTFYPYYFLPIIPSLTLISVYYFKTWGLNLSLNVKKICFILITIFVAANYLISMRMAYNTFYGSAKIYDGETARVGIYIKENSESSDTIFAYVYGATIYQQAERKSASRFISATIPYLDSKNNFGFNYNQKFISDLSTNRPKFLILTKNKNTRILENTEFLEFAKKNYELKQEFDTLEVWQIK